MAATARKFETSPAAKSFAEPLPVSRPAMPSARALLPYLERIDAAGWYSNFGPLLTAFEARLAERFGGAGLTAVANGTVGLSLTLKALGVRPGLRCLMPSWTFVATAHAAVDAGLQPWFADVDPATMALSVGACEALIRQAPGSVGAVIVVAPFGLPLDLAPWRALSTRTGVPVIVDAAAGFDAAAEADLPTMVSLHATKALGVGEGGFVACHDRELIARIRQLSAFGFSGSRDSLHPAINAKLSEYAAAVGLAALDGWPAMRLRYALAAQRLRIALARTPEVAFQAGWGDRWVSSTCVVTLPDGAADRIAERLAEEGVDTRRWWGHGCHLSPAFRHERRATLGETERLAHRTLGLPFWAGMEIELIDRLADVLTRAVALG